MASGRRVRWLICGALAASALTAPGCANSGSVFGRRTTVGSLKASVSQLDFENRQLKKEVATLRAENRDIENRLVQEESHTGELSARLDDARTLLGQRGDEPSSPELDTPRTLPAGRSTRKTRKPPFAQIPNRVDSGATDDDPTDSGRSSRWRGDSGPRIETGPQSRVNDPTVWLPVAQGASDPTPPTRR